jgi:hypothetical protein
MEKTSKFDELTHEVYQVLNEMVRQQEEFDRFGSEYVEIPEYQETVLWLKTKMDKFAEENGLKFRKK